jgi:hypothetical protein
VTFLRFLDCALRVHAARRTYVANVYETVCDRSAFFWLHRLLTAGTPNHGMFILAMLHTLSRVTVVAPTGSQKNLALRPSRDAHRRLRVFVRLQVVAAQGVAVAV